MSIEKKAINGRFGPGGVTCGCCNRAKGGKRARKSSLLCSRKEIRAGRKKAREIAFSDWRPSPVKGQ